MTAEELKKKYLEFFAAKGHAIIPGAPLIPEHDPSVLFTTAGMHPLVPFLLGEKHPAGNRLVDIQKCVRTDDIDEVGDSVHHTFFFMLGNWSLGDLAAPNGIGAGYWKQEAIEWSFEFLTKELKLPIEKLAVSVFAGDNDAPRDEESAKIWQSLGILKQRIYYLPKKDNWWGPAGQTGPCGPDTEMFYWTGLGEPDDLTTGDNKAGWVEIWNDVFMQYNKTAQGVYEPLKQKNVDTGMGLERTLAVLNGLDDHYLTELFLPIIRKIEELSNKKYVFEKGDLGFETMPECWGETMRAMRIVADHIRAAVFLLGEGLEPSNTERGYVLRRLIRRAVRYGKMIGINQPFILSVAKVVIGQFVAFEPKLETGKDFIFDQITQEEQRFSLTLERGMKLVEKLVSAETKETDWGKAFFDLYQSYGFPFEMATEELKGHGKNLNWEEAKRLFEKEYQKHQELSRAGAEQKFKGGLADHSEQTTKYHTVTHLLQAALRKVLGEHIQQKGSNITVERMRFDFSHPGEITPEQLQEVQLLVNAQISKSLAVKFQEMSLDQAKQIGALGWFASRYGERVKVYSIGDFSREICGGPHVENTSVLGEFKIVKLESIGQGIKRIKAVLVHPVVEL
jgi:alanyl-tRNA synthetase